MLLLFATPEKVYICTSGFIFPACVWTFVKRSHVAFGDTLALPLSRRSSLSHFQSPRGCIKGPGFSPNQHLVFRAKPSSCSVQDGELLHEGSRVSWELTFASLRAGLVGCKNRPFPILWSWETTACCLFVCLNDYCRLPGVWHCIALYAEGVSQTVKNSNNK